MVECKVHYGFLLADVSGCSHSLTLLSISVIGVLIIQSTYAWNRWDLRDGSSSLLLVILRLEDLALRTSERVFVLFLDWSLWYNWLVSCQDSIKGKFPGLSLWTDNLRDLPQVRILHRLTMIKCLKIIGWNLALRNRIVPISIQINHLLNRLLAAPAHIRTDLPQPGLWLQYLGLLLHPLLYHSLDIGPILAQQIQNWLGLLLHLSLNGQICIQQMCLQLFIK